MFVVCTIQGSKCKTFYWLDPELPNDYYKQEVFNLIQKEKRMKEDQYGKIRDLDREIEFFKSIMEKEMFLLQLELKESKSSVVFFKKIVVVLCLVIAVMLSKSV